MCAAPCNGPTVPAEGLQFNDTIGRNMRFPCVACCSRENAGLLQRAPRLLLICDAVKLLERDDCGVPVRLKIATSWSTLPVSPLISRPVTRSPYAPFLPFLAASSWLCLCPPGLVAFTMTEYEPSPHEGRSRLSYASYAASEKEKSPCELLLILLIILLFHFIAPHSPSVCHSRV